MPRIKRTFSAEFKAKVVLEAVSGASSQADPCRRHAIKPNLLATWKAAFLERLPTLFQADERRSAEAARVAELERLVGQQALELTILKKASALLGSTAPGGARS